MLPKMICRWGVLVAAACSLAATLGCQRDLGIDDETFACENSTECGDGFVCRANRCVDPDEPLPDVGDAGETGDTAVTDADTGPDVADVRPSPLCVEYCDTFEETCADTRVEPFADRADCLAQCAQIPDHGNEGDTEGDTIQCRLYHLSIAFSAPTLHCGHAAPESTNHCAGRTICEDYCEVMLQACTGDDAAFADEVSCFETCAEYADDGMPGDDTGDTVQCRLFYAGLAAEGATDPNCARAGPRSARDACRSALTDVTIDGSGQGGSFGKGLAGGDFNGDGVGDLAVSAPMAGDSEAAGGIVYIFYGPLDGSDLQPADADARFTGVTGDDGAHIGWALAAGDFDNDGTDDLAIGAPGLARSDSAGGAVYVAHGTADGWGDPTALVADGEGLVQLGTPSNGVRFGAALAAAEVDGGGDDLLVGDPDAVDVAGTRIGAAWLITDAQIRQGSHTVSIDTSARYEHSERGRTFGHAVGFVGRDGQQNVLAFADPAATDDSGAASGFVYLVRRPAGGASGPDDLAADTTATSALTIDAVAPSAQPAQLGRAMLTGRDVTGDGEVDLVLGAPGASDAGAVFVVRAPHELTPGRVDVGSTNAASVLRVESTASSGALGSALGAVTECNGTPQLVVGDRQASTAADAPDVGRAFFLIADGEATISLPAAAFDTLDGEVRAQALGGAVAAVGDVDGNSVEDVAVAALGTSGKVIVRLMPSCGGQ